MIEGDKPAPRVEQTPGVGRKGRNDNWPGCTKKFVNKTLKRRKKNKAAKKSRKANRK